MGMCRGWVSTLIVRLSPLANASLWRAATTSCVSKMNDPYLESADLRNYAWTEFAKEQARIWRIKNELGDGSLIDPAVMKDAPIPVR